MNSPYLVHEFEALARFLDEARLPSTATAVRAALEIDVRAAHRSSWHEPIVDIYRTEVLDSENILGHRDREHHQALLRGLDGVLSVFAIAPDDAFRFLLAAKPLTEAIGESFSNTRAMYGSLVSPRSTSRQSFLNLCLMYLVMCEGIFANQGRLLLGIISSGAASEGDNRQISGTSNVAKQLNHIGMSAFTTGYHRHVRNAIAHGHLRYNASNDSMRFRDYRPTPAATLVFDEEWTFDRFALQYALLDDAHLVISTYLQVHLGLLAINRSRETPIH